MEEGTQTQAAPPQSAPTPGVTGGTSPSPQTGAGGSPSSASPAGTSAGSGGTQPAGGQQPRMYRDEEVQNIVRSRLADEQKKWAPYKELGDPAEIRARLEKAQRMERAFQGEMPPKPTPEEVELRQLLTQHFPGIDKVPNVEQRLMAIEQANNAARAANGRNVIAKLAQEKLGVSDARALKMLEGAVSASIAEDKASLQAWLGGDVSVVEKHFQSVFDSSLDPLLKSASARYTGGKARDAAEVPPPVPRGGTQAPISQERKLTPEERRQAAWNRIQELGGL